MLLKVSRLVGVSIAGMALANSAWAQETNAVNVTTGSDAVKLGGELRGELIYDDHGIDKTEGVDPKATSMIGVTEAKIKLKGNLSPNTEFAASANLLGGNNGKEVLYYFYGTHWFSKMIGFSVGRMKVLQGGFDNIDGNYRSHVEAAYTPLLPYKTYNDMFALHLVAAGKVTLQIVNDVTKASSGGSSAPSDKWANEQGQWGDADAAHPTWILGWRGSFGPIQPLVDIGSYDNNKSRWIDVGVKTEMAGLSASLDYFSKAQADKVLKTGGTEFEAKENTTNGYALNVAYEIKGVAMPWLHVSSAEVKQHGTDVKTNTAGEFDDNGMNWGVGADILSLGKGWTPFAAVVGQSGKFAKTAGGEETRSNLMVKLGALGEI